MNTELLSQPEFANQRFFTPPLVAEKENGYASIVGYRGKSHLDSGCFFCPYIPLTSTPVVFDPAIFEMQKEIDREILTDIGNNI